MKIVCDSCGAKYAIADEKVRGKVFKIRCKKCSNVIVVRGMSGESEASEEQEPLSQPEARTYGYDEQEGAEPAPAGDDAVWHLVIDQEQIGPISVAEVHQRFARGEVDLETYAWREGFGDWTPLGQIDVFADLASGQPAAAAGGADAMAAQAADPFSSSAGAAQGADSDLFGGASAGDGLFAGADAAGGGDRRLRGERNENSVLFSLNNLAALASDAPKAAAASPAASAAPSAGMAQAGGSEGSGLIDIRSMAQAYMGGRDRGVAGPANPLSSFTAVEPVTFASHSPVLLPQAPMAGAGSHKMLYAIIAGLGAVLVIGVLVILLVVLKDDDQPTVAANTPTPDIGKTEDEPKDTKTDTEPGTTKEPAGTDTQANAATEPGTANTANTAATDTRKPDDRRDTRTTRRDDSRSSSGSRDSSKDKETASTPPPPKPESGSGGCLDEVGCLLADKPPACCSKYSGGGGGGGSKRSGGGGSVDSSLPEKLSRSDITSGIGKVRSGVDACKSKGSGEVKVTVKVSGSGSVDNVSVKSAPNPALGSCVAGAVKRASFAKTQQGATFTYPFVL
jgi:TonB family protein